MRDSARASKSTVVWYRATREPSCAPGPYYVYLPSVCNGEGKYFESRGYVDIAFWNPWDMVWTASPYGKDRLDSAVLLYALIPRPDPPVYSLVDSTDDEMFERDSRSLPDSRYFKMPFEWFEMIDIPPDLEVDLVAPVCPDGPLEYLGKIE